MKLTKDMFKSDIDVDTLLKSAKTIIKNAGFCEQQGDAVRCLACPMGKNTTVEMCLAAFISNKYSPDNDYFKATALDLSTQFVALYDKPRVHHINFMEE